MPWFLRIEDIDPPREQPGAVERIKQQCESHGLAWDTWPETKGGRADGVLHQSDRTDPTGPYTKALQQLVQKAMAFRCECSRSVLQQVFTTSRADDAWPTGLVGEDDPATASNRSYPGLCRNKKLPQGRAWRFRSPEVREGLGEDDFILQRADGLWAYHLAVVVDDQWQGITRVVRGEDLQPMQSRHQWLQEALGLAQPDYLHVPVVTNALGQKLSKQTQAEALRTDERSVRQQLAQATEHLKKTMPITWLDQVSPAAKAMGLGWS